MKYQEIPQQDLEFEIAFNKFILSSEQTIEAADAISVFAKQKLEEKGNNSTEKEDELTKSVNKDSEALLNKFADAADAEEKALQNLIKTYGKKKVHEKLKDTLTSLQSESTPSNQSLKVKIMRYIQKTESFSLAKFIQGLVNAVVKIFNKSTPKESSDSQMSNSDRNKESPEPQMSNSDRNKESPEPQMSYSDQKKALIIQSAIADYDWAIEYYKHQSPYEYTEVINQCSQEFATAASEVGEEFLEKFPDYREKIREKINEAKINAATFEANAWLDRYKELKDDDDPESPSFQKAQNKILDLSAKNTQFRSKQLNEELSTTATAILSEQPTQKALIRTRKVQREYNKEIQNFYIKHADLESNIYEQNHWWLQRAFDSSLHSATKLGNINYEHLTPDQQQLHGKIQDMYIKHSLDQVSTLHGTIGNPDLYPKENLTRSAELLKDITALNSTTEEHIGHIKQAGTKQAELEKKYGSPQQKSSNPSGKNHDL